MKRTYPLAELANGLDRTDMDVSYYLPAAACSCAVPSQMETVAAMRHPTRSTREQCAMPAWTSDKAPINPTGTLPTLLRPALVRRAYEKQTSFSTRGLLKRLQHRSRGRHAADELMLVLNSDVGRQRANSLALNKHYGLHNVLYRFMKTQHPDIHKRFLQPAEYTQGELTFLDPARFRAVLSGLPKPKMASIEPDRPWEGLAVMTLAYGLLQPTEAEQLVGALAEFHSAFADYFEATPSSSVTTSTDDVPLDVDAARDPESDCSSSEFALLRELAPIAAQQEEAIAQLSAAQRAGDWARVAGIAAALSTLEGRLHHIASKLQEAHSVKLPAKAPDRTIESWTTEIAQLLRASQRNQLFQLHDDARALTQRCVDLGLATPASSQLDTRAKYEATLRELEPKLAFAEQMRKAHTEGIHSGIRALTPSERLEAYRLLLSDRFPVSPEAILRQLIVEKDELSSLSEIAANITLEAIRLTLSRSTSLPPGTWDLVHCLCRDETLSVLANRDAFSRLSLAADIDLAGLDHIVGDRLEVLPTPIACCLRQRRASSLPAEARQNELLAIASIEASENTVRPLISALLEEGKHRDALYLLHLSHSAGWVFSWGPGELNALWAVLAECATDTTRRPTLEAALSAISIEIVSYEQALAALFVAAITGDVEAYHSLRFGATSFHFDTACERHPPMVTALERLLPVDVPRHDESRLERARSLIADFDRNLAKSSCYGAWAYAGRYQEGFRRVLKERLHALAAGHRLPALPVTDIIDTVRKDMRLPEPEGRALVNMKEFLGATLSTMDELSSFFDIYSLRQLREGPAARSTEPESSRLVAHIANLMRDSCIPV